MAGRRWGAWVLVLLSTRAAHAADVCGGLETLALEATPADLLRGRLKMQVPRGMAAQPRQASIMASPEAGDAETRLFLERDGKKLVVMVTETFRLAGKDLARDAATVVTFAPPQPLPLAAKLRAVAATPPKLEASGEAVLTFFAFVEAPDGAVITLAFYVNPPAAAPGCVELARRLVRTVTAGERKLDVAGGPRELEDGVALTLAPGQLLVPQRGHDFSVFHVFPLLPFTAKGGSALVYLGHHPKSPPGGATRLKVTLFGRPAELAGDATQLDALVPVPGKDKLFAHVSLGAEDAAVRDALAKTLSTLRVK